MVKPYTLNNIYTHNDPKYWDRTAFANSVDLDHMPQNVASDQGLHCCQTYSNIFDTPQGSRMDI